MINARPRPHPPHRQRQRQRRRRGRRCSCHPRRRHHRDDRDWRLRSSRREATTSPTSVSSVREAQKRTRLLTLGGVVRLGSRQG